MASQLLAINTELFFSIFFSKLFGNKWKELSYYLAKSQWKWNVSWLGEKSETQEETCDMCILNRNVAN